MLTAEKVQQITDEALVKIIASKVIVASCGKYFDRIAVDIQDTDVKSTASKVKHHNFTGLAFIKAVGKGS